MSRIYTKGSPISNVYNVSLNAPLDTRLTVSTKSDLTDGTNGIAAVVYRGMVVYVHDEKTLYVYVGASNGTYVNAKTGKPINGGLESNWIKLINPEDSATQIVSSTNEITSPYTGQIVYIQDDTTSSEDESGLAIYNGSTWVKISGTSGGGSSSTETNSVINTSTTDNVSAPTSGTGLSVAKDTTTSVDDYASKTTELSANVNYTSQGIRSYDDSSDGEFEGISFILLAASGDSNSYLKFFSNASDEKNWIEVYINDDSLGITKDDVTYYNADGVETTMTDTKIQVEKGKTIKFAKDVTLSGLYESRTYTNTSKNQSDLVFEDTGSTYEDLDIYTTNPVPVVYAYLNNTSVKVLTETDVNSISDAEIDSLFTTTE